MVVLTFLGNPGKQYAKNRHNIGFIVGDSFLRSMNLSASQKKFNSIVTTADVSGTETLILFPQTYMNNSGKAVREALAFYKVPVEKLIVVHDDIELSFLDIRKKEGGGHKGQNGIRSIMTETGSGNFTRIRFGVGRPENPNVPVADYVLSDFFKNEQEAILKQMDEIHLLLTRSVAQLG
jgi:peptidyl-tRNA hydrolase, PTH1 family